MAIDAMSNSPLGKGPLPKRARVAESRTARPVSSRPLVLAHLAEDLPAIDSSNSSSEWAQSGISLFSLPIISSRS